MAKFFGKNDLQKVSNLTSERVKFYLDAYKKNPNDGLDQLPVSNFNIGENTLYGRVDQNLNSVFPNRDFIVPVARTTNQETAPRVLDFVADMFQDLSANFERACRLQVQPSNDPYLSNLEVFQHYADPEIAYRNYMRRFMRQYNKNYIITGKRAKDIMTLDKYIENLSEFAQQQGEYYPASFTGFMSSNQSSIFNSGLALSITPLDKGDDTAKEEFFLNNSAFQYYLNLCKNIGFSVSKNSPWVIVADLASPAIQPYLNRYNLFTVKDVFNQRFKQTYLSDYEKITQSIITYYREFVNTKPYEKTIKSCMNKTNAEIKFRQTVNNNSITYINNNILLNTYIDIRNIEERNIINNNDIIRLKRDSKSYFKLLSQKETFLYINNVFFKLRTTQDGSFAKIKNNKKDLTNDPENVTNISSLFSGGY